MHQELPSDEFRKELDIRGIPRVPMELPYDESKNELDIRGIPRVPRELPNDEFKKESEIIGDPDSALGTARMTNLRNWISKDPKSVPGTAE